LLLNNLNAFCRVAFSLTPSTLLEKYVREADVVVAACGVPHLVRSAWIKPGAVVVDVGINFVEQAGEQKFMCGDVEFNE